MGSAESRNLINSTVNVMSKSTNTVALEQATSVRSYQAINVTGTAGNVRITGNKMEASVSVTGEGYVQAMQSNEVNQDISQQLEQMGTAVVSGINFGNSSKVSNEVNNMMSATSEVTNAASASCRTAVSSSQSINVAETGGDVEISGNEMKATIEVLAKCRLDAVQGNSTIQKLQNTIKQTAEARTIGLDPLAFIGAFLMIIVVVVLGGVIGVKQVFSGTVNKLVPIVFIVLGLVGIGVLIYALIGLAGGRREVQPPKGTSLQDFVVQFPFLKHSQVHDRCAAGGTEVIVDGALATELIGPDAAAGKRGDVLVAWGRDYNRKVDRHMERAAQAGVADYARLPLAEAEARRQGPGEDAPTDRRWAKVLAAYIGPGTVIGAEGRRVPNPDPLQVKIWAYSFVPATYARIWSQWEASDTEQQGEFSADSVYVDRPDMYERTTANGIRQLIKRGGQLLDALVAIVARPEGNEFQGDLEWTPAGQKRGLQRANAMVSQLSKRPMQQCGPWIRPYMPVVPDAVAKDPKSTAPITGLLEGVGSALSSTVVSEADRDRFDCRPAMIFWFHVLSHYNMNGMLQQPDLPAGPKLWQMLTGMGAQDAFTVSDLPTATGSNAVGHVPQLVDVQVTPTMVSRVEPLVNMVARARRDAADEFKNTHAILSYTVDPPAAADNPAGPPDQNQNVNIFTALASLTGPDSGPSYTPVANGSVVAKSNWYAAWSSNMLNNAQTPFQTSPGDPRRNRELNMWDIQFSEWQNELARGYEWYNNGSPGDESTWRHVTMVFEGDIQRGNVSIIKGIDNPILTGEKKAAGFGLAQIVMLVIGIVGLIVVISVIGLLKKKAAVHPRTVAAAAPAAAAPAAAVPPKAEPPPAPEGEAKATAGGSPPSAEPSAAP